MKDFKPKIFKYKKYHNNLIIKKLKKKEFKHFKLILGCIGLKALKSSVISSLQISVCIKYMVRNCKNKYKIWLYCFPNISLTAKSISVRMGKGIGSIINWIFVIKKNTIFLEIFGKSKDILLKSLKKCKKKIPLATKIIIDNYKKKWRNFKYFI